MAVDRVFVGDDDQYFPDLARWVAPGDTVEFDEAPDDPRFVTASHAKKSKTPASPAESEESE